MILTRENALSEEAEHSEDRDNRKSSEHLDGWNRTAGLAESMKKIHKKAKIERCVEVNSRTEEGPTTKPTDTLYTNARLSREKGRDESASGAAFNQIITSKTRRP